MAVIPAVDSIKVQVLVNNVPLEEYNPDDDEIESKTIGDDRMISRYIEARTDAEFTVQYAVDKSFQHLHRNVDLSFAVSIDGVHMNSQLIRRKTFSQGCGHSFKGHRYYANNMPRMKPFKFGQLNIGKWASAGKADRS